MRGRKVRGQMTTKNQMSMAESVIAEAEKAVAELGTVHDARVERLAKLHELFSVVEERYHAQQQELADRDEQIRALAEANEILTGSLRTLTAAAQRAAHDLGAGDQDLTRAVERSESLVAKVFGTGGNANPTQPPDTAPSGDGMDMPEGAMPRDVSEEIADSDAFDDEGEVVELDAEDEPPQDAAPEDDALDIVIEDLEMADEVSSDADAEAGEEEGGAHAAPGVETTDDLAFEDVEPLEAGDDDEQGSSAPVLPEDWDADEAAPGEPAVPAEAEEKAEEEVREPVIQWSDAWSVGAPEMDRDHRVLINLINQLPAALDKASEQGWVVGNLLNSLWDYTDYHFGREEALQKAANFPGAEEHTSRHRELKAQVRDWLDRYQDDPDSVDGDALLTFLKGWLTNHILGEDMRYKPYVQNNPDAQAVAAAIKVRPDLLEDLGDAAKVD